MLAYNRFDQNLGTIRKLQDNTPAKDDQQYFHDILEFIFVRCKHILYRKDGSQRKGLFIRKILLLAFAIALVDKANKYIEHLESKSGSNQDPIVH